MQFTDPFFLFYFLPVALLVLRVAGRNAPRLPYMLAVVVLTLGFYGFEKIYWIGIFIGTAAATYLAARVIAKSRSNGVRFAMLVIGMAIPIGFLFVFKYLSWLALYISPLMTFQTFIMLLLREGKSIALPAGISFYTFEAISFLIDVYRRKYRPPSAVTYLSFLAMFPRFIAGPIVRYDQVAAQYSNWKMRRLSDGMTIFAIGFSLKIFGADSAAEFVPYAFGTLMPAMLPAWFGTIAYAVQLYLDFWGYSLMAVGIGLAIGLQFPDNFRLPYKANSVSDFWRRWHITLGSWLRDYIYIPLGGARSGQWRVAINLFVTMLIGGLWHGANLTFVVWGGVHGALLAVERLTGLGRKTNYNRFNVSRTFLVILLTWVIFRADSMTHAGNVYLGMVGFNGFLGDANWNIMGTQLLPASLFCGSIVFILFFERQFVFNYPIWKHRFGGRSQMLALIAFVAAVVLSMSTKSTPFLYFQF